MVKLLGLYNFFSISKIGKQVICEISSDLGNLERIQLFKSESTHLLLTFLLKRDLLFHTVNGNAYLWLDVGF